MNLSPSSQPDHSQIPFQVLKSRYLVFGTFLMASLGAGSIYALLSLWRWVPRSSEDPISTPTLAIAVSAIMALSIFWVGHSRGLKARYVFGQSRPKFSVLLGIVLVISLLLFSLGISTVFIYFLSLGFPGYVSQLLEDTSLMNGDQSAYPQLYRALMLFWSLVSAPVVEELVFRGILLQRWSVKWGLRAGVITSSVLFGALHPQNPLGLTLFGLAMALLYVRTKSLWVPIACHSLNNLVVVGIDWLSKIASGGQISTVSDLQELWWMSLILVALSLPFLSWFIWRSWPKRTDEIPYAANLGG